MQTRKIKNLIIILTLSILVWVLLIHPSFAREPFLSYSKIQKLDPGRTVYLNAILENGGFLMLSRHRPTGVTRLLLVNRYRRVYRKIDLPATEIEYVNPGNEGRNVLVYSQKNYSFYMVDTRRGEVSLLESATGSKPGFALFGGKKSRLFYADGRFYAWGYYYDRAGEYAGEWLVRLHPDKAGKGFTERIVEMIGLLKKAEKMCPGCRKPGFMGVAGNNFVFSVTDGRKGGILAYDMEKKSLMKVMDFAHFSGADISRNGRYLAYVIRPVGSAAGEVLFIYDMEKKLPVKAIPGNFFNPVINLKSGRLALGDTIDVAGKVIASKITVVPIPGKEGKKKVFRFGGGRLLDWKFVSGNRLMVITTNGDIYSVKL